MTAAAQVASCQLVVFGIGLYRYRKRVIIKKYILLERLGGRDTTTGVQNCTKLYLYDGRNEIENHEHHENENR